MPKIDLITRGPVMKVPKGVTMPGLQVTVLNRAKPRAEFDAKRAELARNGIQAGSFVREYGAGNSGGSNLSEQVYQNLTMVANDGKIFHIRGSLRDRWAELGGQFWGYPTMDEASAGVGDGTYALFELTKKGIGGSRAAVICWSNVTGAFEVSGIACDKYLALGGIIGIGYPITGTWSTANGDGFYNNFRKAYVDDLVSTIWVPRDWKQAWYTFGGIYQLYAQMGYERSPLGYPKSDEFGPYDGPNPERRQYFEGGTIIWRPNVGAFVEMPDYMIFYRGLHAVRVGSDNAGDANSEFYFISNSMPRVNPDQAWACKLPPHEAEYGALRTGRWRADNVLVYAGSSDSVMLSISGAERDMGNPDAYLGLIQGLSKKGVSAAIQGLGALLGGIPAAVGSTLGSPLGDLLGNELGGLINGILDTGDDPLRSIAVPLSYQTIVAYLNSPPAQASVRQPDGRRDPPLSYHFVVRMSGDGSELDLLFEVVRGRP